MRILLLTPLLLVGACNVSTDNNAVTVQYDQNTAENTMSDIGNTAENMGAAIGNEVDETANKVDNSAIVANDEGSSDGSNEVNQQ